MSDQNTNQSEKTSLAAADLVGADGYKLITGLVVPRPIGWIGSRSPSGDNIRATGEFTVNVVTDEVAEAMNATSASLEAGDDEFEHAGLTAVDGSYVNAPMVLECKAQLECRLVHELHIGDADGGNWLLVGEVVAFHINSDLLDGTRVDQAKLKAVGRHAGNSYSRTSDLFDLIRPA